MKIAVCEDNVFEVKLIYRNLKFVLKDLAVAAEVMCFSNGEDLLDSVRKGEIYQLYVLDIMLGEGKNGISIAREICAWDERAQIAFLTGSREYAVEAFEIGAFHYLVKPVTEHAVRAIIERWHMREYVKEQCLELNYGREKRKFPQSQILYMRSRDRGVEVHMKHHKWDSWVKVPFHTVEEKICQSVSFAKIARGCIVNMEHVRRMDGGECFLSNGEILSISRREYSSVRNCYNDFLFWKMKQDGG
ncbi:MAG: response regulator transcription factor [Lachnospiraceae bacterium]|nr:response regulator transcription factor [Lachnospiraceae bacterium]